MTKLHILLMDKEKKIEDIKKDIEFKQKAFLKQNQYPLFYLTMSKPQYKKKYKNIWQTKYKSFFNYFNEVDNFGNTALIYAIRRNDIDILNLILETDKNKTMNLNLFYIQDKVPNFINLKPEIHNALIEHKSERAFFLDIIKTPFNSDKEKNNKPTKRLKPILTKVLESNNIKLIELYLDEIINTIDLEELKDRTTRRNKKLKQILNSRDKHGETILSKYIKIKMPIEILNKLIYIGIDINKKSSDNLNLNDFIQYDIFKNLDMQQDLEEYKKNAYNDKKRPFKINEKGIVTRRTNKFKNDESPIHIAYNNNNIEVLKLLLEQPNIKAKIKDKNGKTLLDKKNKLPLELQKIIELKFKDFDLTI
jgi:ankyrin repeat protein